MVSVSGLCTVTPFSPGWIFVVYPSSDYLLTLARDFFSPGSTSASRAAIVICSKGSSVFVVVVRVEPSGRYTSSFDFPMFGKFILLLMKCDVAPESIMMSCARLFCLLSTLLVHLFSDIVCAFGVFSTVLFIFSFLCHLPLQLFLVGPNSSWQPGKFAVLLFYSTLFPGATSLFLLLTPRTFRCFCLISTRLNGS